MTVNPDDESALLVNTKCDLYLDSGHSDTAPLFLSTPLSSLVFTAQQFREISSEWIRFDKLNDYPLKTVIFLKNVIIVF